MNGNPGIEQGDHCAKPNDILITQTHARTVDDFYRNNKEGSIFELKVGNEKLLVCGFNINNQSSPVAGQLRNSLINYMQSP